MKFNTIQDSTILDVSLLEKIDFTDTENLSCERDEMFHLFMLSVLYDYYQNLYECCSAIVHSHWTPLDFKQIKLGYGQQ